MRRELSSARPETAGQPVGDPIAPINFRKLVTRKFVVGTAATAALAAAAGLGAAAPAMTSAADATPVVPAATVATATQAAATAAAVATAAAGVNVDDAMTRTVRGGLGSATIGGSWTPWGATVSVSGGDAHLAKVQPGVAARATLEGVKVRDESLSVTFSVPAIPTRGTGSFFGLLLRRQANGDALYARVKVAPKGVTTLSVAKVVGASGVIVGTPVTFSAPLVANRAYVLDATATGSSSTSVKARLYVKGATTPAYQTSGRVAVSGALAGKGSVGVYVYAASGGAAFSVDVDKIAGKAAVTSSTSTPTSAPTSSAPTSSSPTSDPTTDTPTASPTTAVPTDTGTTPTTDPSSPASTADPTGGIGFATGSPTGTPTPTDPPSTGTPTPTDPPTTGTPTPADPPAGKPGPSNTGVRPGTNLTVFNGTLTATAGQVIQNLEIRGALVVRVPNVTVRNVIVRGFDNGTQRPLVDALSATNLTIVDSEIAPLTPSVNNAAAIWGKNFSLTRVDIHGVVDGIDVLGPNVTVTNSWVHDLTWFASSVGQHGGATHNDSIQVFGGANLTVTGSRFEGTSGSVMQLSTNAAFGPVTGMSWVGNWIDGGSCSLNISAGAAGTLAPITLTNNRFGNHQTIAGCAIIANLARTPLTMVGNVWDANDQPVTPKRG